MKKDNKPVVFNQYETVSPATKLLEKRRKMYEIHEAFEAEKQDFRQKQVGFQQSQEKIKVKDRQFQQDMTKFCQFSQENQLKKKKAEEKVRFEEKTYLQKEEQIKNLQREIKELTKSQKIFQNKVSHFRKYQQYLEKVRTTYNDQYPQMVDILNRYQTLKKSNDDLITSRTKMQQDHDGLKKQSLNQQKSLNQAILTISNETKELSRRIQEKTKQKNQIQSEVERSNEEFSNKNLNLGKIFMAIDNLYFRCNQNSFLLKHDFDEKILSQKKEFKTTKNQTNVSKNDEEISFEQKSKIASIKLKSIVSHMKDFKVIIDLYKNYKQEKP